MDSSKVNISELMFQYIDQVKFLFFPDQWSKIFLDYSRNEIFTLIYLYRNPHVNMTEVASYINVPLNTATGVVGRMEKKGLILRERDGQDKRIVTLCLTEMGEQFVRCEIEEIEKIYERVAKELTQEEFATMIKVVDRILEILKTDAKKETSATKKQVKRIPIE